MSRPGRTTRPRPSVKARGGEREPARRLLASLGLAARAGRLRIGTEAVRRSIRAGEAAAVVIAGDASLQVRVRLAKLAEARSLAHRVILDSQRLGGAVGRARVVALAVTDRSLARRVLELAEELEG